MTTKENIDLRAITFIKRYLTILINLSSFEVVSTPGDPESSDFGHQGQ